MKKINSLNLEDVTASLADVTASSADVTASSVDVTVSSIILAQAIGLWGNFFNKEAPGGIFNAIQDQNLKVIRGA